MPRAAPLLLTCQDIPGDERQKLLLAQIDRRTKPSRAVPQGDTQQHDRDMAGRQELQIRRGRGSSGQDPLHRPILLELGSEVTRVGRFRNPDAPPGVHEVESIRGKRNLGAHSRRRSRCPASSAPGTAKMGKDERTCSW